MSEVVGAFVCAEARHEEANSAAKAALRPLGSFAQIRLELAVVPPLSFLGDP
jgi:hypothetical protein